jgi:hypothetical protein
MGSIWRLDDITAWAQRTGRTLDLDALSSTSTDPTDTDDDHEH